MSLKEPIGMIVLTHRSYAVPPPGMGEKLLGSLVIRLSPGPLR